MPSPLELAPPQPAQVGQPGPPPNPSMQGLNGNSGGPDSPSDQSMQIVTQHLMEAEQSMRAAARVKPELSALVDKFVNEMKPQAGQILFGAGQQQQQASPSGIAGMLASGASALNAGR